MRDVPVDTSTRLHDDVNGEEGAVRQSLPGVSWGRDAGEYVRPAGRQRAGPDRVGMGPER